MADRLVEFLIELDKNDEMKQKYLSDPKGTAEKFGLAPADVEICANNDTETMKKRCESEGADTLDIGHLK